MGNTRTSLTKAFSVFIIVAGALLLILHGYHKLLPNLALVMATQAINRPIDQIDENWLKLSTRILTNQANDFPDRYFKYGLRVAGLMRKKELAASRPNTTSSSTGIAALFRLWDQLAQKHPLDFRLMQYSEQSRQVLDNQVNEEIQNVIRELTLSDFNNVSSFPSTSRTLLGGTSRMILTNYFVDESDLDQNRPVHVVLVWQDNRHFPLSGIATFNNGDSWLSIAEGNTICQIGLAKNLVEGGSFENTLLPFQGLPQGFPNRLYSTQLLTYSEVTPITPDDYSDFHLDLFGHGISSVGLGSLPIAVTSSLKKSMYLVVGNYRSSANAKPLIGVRWLLAKAQSWNDNKSDYIMNAPSIKWHRFGAVVLPPDDTISAQMWLINKDGQSVLAVDNLGFFAVPFPLIDEQ